MSNVMNILCCRAPDKTDKSTQMADFTKLTREMEGRVDGARISTMNKSDEITPFLYPDSSTIYELFLKGLEISKNGDLFGTIIKDEKGSTIFKWITYSEGKTIIQQVGSGFNKLGLIPGEESYVGIFSKNRPEWSLTDICCSAFTYTSVPLYDTLGDEAVSHILTLTEMKVVVCDNSKKAIDLLNRNSHLKHIIVIDELTSEARELADKKDITILTFEDLKTLGKNNLINEMPAKPTNLNTICFTSGTTGMPKGVLLTHANLTSTISTLMFYLKRNEFSNENAEQHRYLSYLPLAHILEKAAQASLIGMGAKIGFFRGDITLLVEDIQLIRPTLFVTVPRLMNKIYSKIKDNVAKSSSLKQRIFRWAYANQEKHIMAGNVGKKSNYEFAFKATKAALGGCVKLIITGSAPISGEVLHFMRVVFSCNVLEGYGATETGGACTLQLPGEYSVGNVGPPLLCSIIKLIDVPEMGLVVSRDNRGEICVSGANVFKGYYKEPEKTEAVLINGWYHTGDIGIIEQNGSLKIVDRVKNIFKLQQGEYIAPEKIENVYAKVKYVTQSFVYGDSMKSTLIGIIVPEETTIFEWAKLNSLEENMTILCKNSDLKKLILNELNDQGKADGLKSFEQVKDIHLCDELFTHEKGFLTPTMKSKRNELKKYFQKEIDEMYKNLD